MKILRVMAIGVTVGGLALVAMNTEKAEAAEWTPRTVEQIKADIAKTNGKEYTIVWGDTLSGISQATNITVQKLADMNQIANVDLIYAGNKLVFEGSVVSVENAKGDTVAQTVIQPEDKVDPKKTVGQPVQGKDTTSNKKADNKTDKNAAADSKADTKKADVKSDDSSSENGKQADSTPGENKDGSAETPSQPANNANQNDVAGGSSNQGQTTPSTPSNNGGATTPSQQSTTGNQGGSTTPAQPNTDGNTSGSQGGTTQPVQPTQPSQSDSGNGGTATSKFYVGQVLYSKSFATTAEAEAHMDAICDEWWNYADTHNINVHINAEGGGPYTVYVTVSAVN